MEVVEQLSQLLDDSSPDSIPSVPQENSRETSAINKTVLQKHTIQQIPNQQPIQKNQVQKLQINNTNDNNMPVKSIVSATTVADSTKEDTKESKNKKKQQYLLLCTAKTRYVVVKKACRQLGFKQTEDEQADWDLYWCDTGGITPEQLQKMQPYQRINHFPGMYQLARKNNLCRNLMRMARIFKEDYNIFPKTWQLPSEMADFKAQFTNGKTNNKKAKTFIVKPVHLCQGRGIYLVRKFEDVDLKQGEQYVAQRYLHKPYLIDGLKFDLRIYALVYGVDPLRVFVYQEGLARFATEEYVGPSNGNLDNLFMHLTNYAINKNSENFVFNEDQDDDSSGHKRSLTSVLDHFRQQGLDSAALWQQIQDIIAKTLISVQPSLQHTYRSVQPEDLENSMCFEVLGFDIIIDHKFRPYVLEVNHASSFGTDSPLDKKVKLDLMRDTFTMLNLSIKRKKQLKKDKEEAFKKRVMGEKGLTKFEKEQVRKKNQLFRDEFDMNHLGNYKLVYPVLDDPVKAKKFDAFLEQSKNIWSEFTGGAKAQIAQANLKQIQQQKQNIQIAGTKEIQAPRTDPQQMKSKAQFLQQAYQKQSSGNIKPGLSNNDQNKVFVKRNIIYNNSQMRNPSSASVDQNQLISLDQNQSLPYKHQASDYQFISDGTYISSPAKVQEGQNPPTEAFPTDYTPQLHTNGNQSSSLSGLMTTFEFGMMPHSNQLAEAIHKRFPMVRLQQASLTHYGAGISGNSAGLLNSPGISNTQHQNLIYSRGSNSKQTVSLNRQSYPGQGSNDQRIQPFSMSGAFNNSNEMNGLNTNSTAISASQYSNPSSHNTKIINGFPLHQKKGSKSQPGPSAAYQGFHHNQMHQSHQQHFFIQNQNTSLIQNMERYNILKHIEAVKRTINNPQLNMMKQKISQKYQTFAQQNSGESQPMAIGKPIQMAQIYNAGGARHSSSQSQVRSFRQIYQKQQPQSLAEWLQLGNKDGRGLHQPNNKSNPRFGSLTAQKNNISQR